MNLWHTHGAFRGTHTHDIAGRGPVEHAHTGDRLEVVELDGRRYKAPRAPAADGGAVVVLEVDDGLHDGLG